MAKKRKKKKSPASDSQTPKKARRMIWLYVALGLLAILIVGPIVVLSLYVDDWSRDLTTNHAETRKSDPNPLLQPLVVPGDRDKATALVTDAIVKLEDWSIESITTEGKRTIVNATRTTKLLKFTDDIRVYLNDAEDGVQITVTSQSRVGKGDLGQNPRNIAELMSKVRERLKP
ncbi:hypothetical protein Pan97_01840 [Bremerella volcania]|uniref:DUF1499 domain-containing protein n=1 Tax=Bremerella volcania TaxID=2527984 RepID=A0A518C1W5_9BACT|nr:DUF1499 domain-containing protein [Bremerella volcania]QDU73217.1 hypothetical protein Pan97_01840 [Bremerella volcania]